MLLAAELCDSPDWILSGAATSAQHPAALADVDACTAREWIPTNEAELAELALGCPAATSGGLRCHPTDHLGDVLGSFPLSRWAAVVPMAPSSARAMNEMPSGVRGASSGRATAGSRASPPRGTQDRSAAAGQEDGRVALDRSEPVGAGGV